MDRIITSLGLMGIGVADGVDVSSMSIAVGSEVACGAQPIKVKPMKTAIKSKLILLLVVIIRLTADR
jgi:hypothetical protein